MKSTAGIRKHKYINTGVSTNKPPYGVYTGDILRCSRCDRIRVVLSDVDMTVAMKERGCVGYNKA